MKILLFALNASYVHTNIAVRAIRDTVIAAGHSVRILECTLKDRRDDVLSALYSADCDAYGFSCYIWNIQEMLSFAQKLKLLKPQTRIIFGGPEVSFENEEFFTQYPFVDCIIRGEGENAWKIICGQLPQTHSLIDGSVCREFGENEGILYESHETISGNLLYYESVRGCPYRCAYCLSALSDTIRAKPFETVRRDLLRFEELYAPIHVIKFVDRTFNYNSRRARAIWKLLQSPEFSKCYHFEICAALLSNEDFEIISQLPKGKVQFEVGVQSLNRKTREAIHRTDDLGKCLTNLNRLYQLHNVMVHADLIAGLPYESYASFALSFDGVFGKCHKLQLGFLKLLKGSELRSHTQMFGYLYDPEPPYEVLQTSDISYPELKRLKDIAEAVERYANSGSFTNSINFLMTETASPFAFFESLVKYLGGSLYALSQNKAFEKLCSFANVRLEGEKLQLFQEKLALDYLLTENGRLPEYLKSAVLRCDDETKKRSLRNMKEREISLFVPAAEVIRFSHDPYISVIDRKNRVRYTLDL